MHTKTEAVGLSMWIGDAPPASTTLSLIFHDEIPGRQNPVTRIRHLSLMDLSAISDASTGLSGPAIIDLMGRFIAQLEAIPDAPRSD